ncbi:5'-nucleotidase C-terminal domain-containing protein [Tianweitania populi]|uniref:Multifunctional 2',3'-cyclic-nucleotide 2'-phosphodiesterase/5'-nucleotidase/3'-nucleotidase n=1 Tax=Tianweitania populi TaxID=1607949 RepID=A0A8J3DVS4_9HYPH|nr:5'-nucleotidase C-terminal domain-containing protein [Tianweitania populi]GHD11477.1 multifunctional 2',3'-cyclic-nucleotide 2'-phosphodiesterase/5'-nucleotidase/3'-nucleotidase [Tianweitania populi]
MKKLTLLAALSTSILGLSAGASWADYTLNILHINDWHSRIEGNNKYESTCSQEEKDKGECIGGAARLVTAIRQQREALNGQNVLVLDAGDNYQGSLFFQTYHGDVETEFSNLIKFDAMTVGNHEFDDGEDGLMRLLDKAQFPVLGANVKPNAQSKVGDKLKPSTVVEIGGQKIGIVGIVTTDTPDVATPGPNLAFEDDVEAVKREVKALTDQGVNKIVALTHVGYVRDRDTIAKIPGVDVVVGGHSHTFLSNTDDKAEGPYPTMVDGADGQKVPVVTAASYSKYLGKLTVVFDDNGVPKQANGDPIYLDKSIPEDEGVLKRVAELGGPIEELKNKQVGEFTAAVDGSRETCRAQECAMGNLIADAILDRTKDQGVTIALQNGGGIRASIDSGPVTMGEVLTVLPFQNTIATFQLSGKDLRDSLEAGLSEIEEGKGKFPQVAGIKYTFDKSVAPNGGRLKSIEVKDGGAWAALDPAKTYTIATNNFVRTGGDGYKLFADKAENAYDFGPSLEQVLADYITAHSPYTPALDGRITLAQAGTTQAPASEPAATPAPSQPTAAETTTPAPTTPPADLTPPSSGPSAEPSATPPPAATTTEPAQPSQSSATTEPGSSSITAGGTHTIVQGDTLWDIAEAAYGDGTQWRRIQRANPGLQVHRLFVGTELQIPGRN